MTSFKLRQVMKYWVQAPPYFFMVKFLFYQQYPYAFLSLAALATVRYYSRLRYPFLQKFESYYTE